VIYINGIFKVSEQGKKAQGKKAQGKKAQGKKAQGKHSACHTFKDTLWRHAPAMAGSEQWLA
jgi:hypothetical protein